MTETGFDWMAFGLGFALALVLVVLIRRSRKPRVDMERSVQQILEIPNDIKPTILKLRAQGETIQAIKLVRERTGCNLAAAKKAVERLV